MASKNKVAHRIGISKYNYKGATIKKAPSGLWLINDSIFSSTTLKGAKKIVDNVRRSYGYSC